MTNKSLSKQLCEVCGIEPKYQCNYHSCTCPIQDIDKFNSKCPKQAVTKECDARSNKPCYIDFENNNNNFVKLMELDFDSCSDEDIRFPSLWCFLNSFMFALRSREDYLIYLLGFLKDNRSEWRENLHRDVKQAIKQEQWEV